MPTFIRIGSGKLQEALWAVWDKDKQEWYFSIADVIAVLLGGLPPIKTHCSVLAVDGLRAAIQNYEERRGLVKERVPLALACSPLHSSELAESAVSATMGAVGKGPLPPSATVTHPHHHLTVLVCLPAL